MMPDVSPGAITEYGILVIIAALALSGFIYWFIKERPTDKQYQRTILETVVSQVAISTKAIETSNLVISQNSELLKETQASHGRLGERFGALELCFKDHDKRAQDMQVTLEGVDTKLDQKEARL